MESLKDQVAVVTGASSGIGKAIALALAQSIPPMSASASYSFTLYRDCFNQLCDELGMPEEKRKG